MNFMKVIVFNQHESACSVSIKHWTWQDIPQRMQHFKTSFYASWFEFILSDRQKSLLANFKTGYKIEGKNSMALMNFQRRLGEIQWFGISLAADPYRSQTMWFQ